MKKFFKVFSLLIVCVLLFTLAACGAPKSEKKSGGRHEREAADPYTPISITLKVRVAKVQINNTVKLTYVITPATAQGDKVTVSISDDKLAAVAIEGTNNVMLTAKDKIGSVKVTVETSNGLKASKTIKIQEEPVESYPDLSGYQIKIAQAESAIGEYDVNYGKETADKYGYYDLPDRDARIEAWNQIEENYNCQMDVIAYPSDAPWGPARWTYILTQAQNSASEYDLYVAPYAQIPNFVAGNAILDVTEWYAQYGNNYMDDMAVTTASYKGRLYAFSQRYTDVTENMGYNYNLWKKLNEKDPTLKEPAQAYLDGEWTYSYFKEYCLKVQTAMETYYSGENYYALSGVGSKYWLGMVNSAGVKILDSVQLKANITGKYETLAGEVLRDIYAAGGMDPAFQVDGSVATWNVGHALFNTGSFYFYNYPGRWEKELWGEGETLYGYVPFPTGDDCEKTYIGTTGDGFFQLAAGRDWAYKGYGEECTTENIYRAFLDYQNTAKNLYRSSEDYDYESYITTIASNKFGSEASIKAYVRVMCGIPQEDGTFVDSINDLSFYDPFVGGSIVSNNGGSGTVGGSINSFIKGTDAAQWIDAVGVYKDSMEKALIDFFG